MLRIELVKSPIGNTIRNRRTVAALGLRKVHQVVEQPDNPSIRGMIHHVKHLLKFEVVEGEVKGKDRGEAGGKGKGKVASEAKGRDGVQAALTDEKPAPKPKAAAKSKPEAPAKAAAKAAPKKKAEAKS